MKTTYEGVFKLTVYGLDKLRHTRSVAYSVELVLLNKQHISSGGAYPDCYPVVVSICKKHSGTNPF